jgi:multiple sugar transport system permease protein
MGKTSLCRGISVRLCNRAQLTLTGVRPAFRLQNFLAAADSPWELLMTVGLIYAVPPAAIYYAFKRYMGGGLIAGAAKA